MYAIQLVIITPGAFRNLEKRTIKHNIITQITISLFQTLAEMLSSASSWEDIRNDYNIL